MERDDLEGKVKQIDADCLLVITGFSKKIGQEEYRTQNPGISPEAIEWARKNLKRLRMIGTDSISISNQENSPRGRAAHKSAFEEKKGCSAPLLVAEGIDLGPLRGRAVKKLRLFPWFGGPADSSPCTIIAEV